MRKRTIELGGEQESGIDASRVAAPKLAPLRLDVPVEGGIDLQHVDELRHVLDGMLRLFELRRVHDPFPVLVGPPCGSDVDARGESHRWRQGSTGAGRLGARYKSLNLPLIAGLL